MASKPNALVELFRAAGRSRFSAWLAADTMPRRGPDIVPANTVWNSADGPAQRYLDAKGQRRYRRWSGPTGGAWPRKARVSSSDSERSR